MMNDNFDPKISVVIVTFNRSKVIERAIRSFSIQDYPCKELVVIDGGSTDGTVEIIKKLRSSIACWISEPDRGIYHAFNKGVERATGDWVFFLGSDDYFHDPSILSKAAAYLSKVDMQQHKIVYGKVSLVSSTGTYVDEMNKPWEQVKNKFLQGCYICHQGVFQHRDLFKIHGNFDEAFKISGVYDFMLRELKDRDALFMPDITVASMEVGGGLSSDPENTIKVMREYSKARTNNKIKNFPHLLYWGYIKAYARLFVYRIFGENITLAIVDIARKLTGRTTIWNQIQTDSE